MKKIIMTMMAAMLVNLSAMAQEESKTEKRPERKFDKTEMVKHRTDETVSRYKLTDKQAKQLLELNTKYADKMMPRGPHHHGRPGGPGAGRPPMPPKDTKAERPMPPKEDDAKMKERRQEMDKTMKAYEAELKKIMTDEQYKSYQADRKKHPRF